MRILAHLALALLAFGSVPLSTADDPLPSWNDTSPRKAIIAFVERVAEDGSSDFVPAPERIAVFDNDGTLWAEQPMYFQGLMEMPAATHTGMTAEEFSKTVSDWIATAKHPKTGKFYTEMVHHDDAQREWAYDRASSIGKLDKAWDEAVAKGWTVVSMKDDGRHVFAFDRNGEYRGQRIP